MSKINYSLSNSTLTNTSLQQLYENAKESLNVDFPDLNTIFSIAISEKTLFPNIKVESNDADFNYIVQWITNYHKALQNPPHSRIAKPKTSCNDPSVKMIVKTHKNYNDAQATEAENAHILFMSAENIQGNLLEEFIATKINPYGFIWCLGEVLHSVDFCNQTGSCLLQIKNKNNTENSSSSAIRNNTSIQKWFRLGTRTQNGMPIPDFKWSKLNDIVNDYAITQPCHPCNITEEEYLQFLENVTSQNRQLITHN